MSAILLIYDLELEKIVAWCVRKLSHVVNWIASCVLTFLQHCIATNIPLNEEASFGVNSTILNSHTVHVKNVIVWNLIVMDIDAYVSNWKCFNEVHLLACLVILFFFSLEIAIIH